MGNAQQGTRALVLRIGLQPDDGVRETTRDGSRLRNVLARAVISLAITWLALRRVGLSPWGTNGDWYCGSAGTVALLCCSSDSRARAWPLSSVHLSDLHRRRRRSVLKEQLGRLIVVATGMGWGGDGGSTELAGQTGDHFH